jgi:hypothetical protein
MPVILATQEAETRKTTIQSQSGQIAHKTLSQKYSAHKKKGAGGVAQKVECLPSRHEALSSNSS